MRRSCDRTARKIGRLLPWLVTAVAGAATAAGAAAWGQTVAAPMLQAAPAPGGGSVSDAIAAAPDLARFAAAAKATGFDATLAGPGPFTLFAPTDAAFGRLAPGSLAALFDPEHRASLTRLLAYHVVPGRLTLADLIARTQAGGGTTTLTTLAGQPLTVTYADGVMMLTDAGGHRSYVEAPDRLRANGVVHAVNGVLVPRLR